MVCWWSHYGVIHRLSLCAVKWDIIKNLSLEEVRYMFVLQESCQVYREVVLGYDFDFRTAHIYFGAVCCIRKNVFWPHAGISGTTVLFSLPLPSHQYEYSS